jgi:hypothetical protein
LRVAQAELARVERETSLFREQFRGMLEAYSRSLESQPHPRELGGAAVADEDGRAGPDGDAHDRSEPTTTPH